MKFFVQPEHQAAYDAWFATSPSIPENANPYTHWLLTHYEEARALDPEETMPELGSDSSFGEEDEGQPEPGSEQQPSGVQWPDVLSAGEGAENFLLVDGVLHVASQHGFWAPLSHEALAAYLRFALGSWQERKTVTDAGAQLSGLAHYRPEWLKSVSHGSMNSEPLIQNSHGSVFSLKTGKTLDRKTIRETLTLNSAVPSAEYDPALLENPPDGVNEALRHYGEPLLTRLAWQLLGPHKTIDVINLPVSNAGKSTLAEWVQQAFPNGVEILDAVRELKNGNDFSPLRVALAERLITFVDEADKIETPPPVAVVNELTQGVIQINLKGIQSRSRPRRGNIIMLGADWPNLVSGQGSDTRFQWAWAQDTSAMSQELRDLLFEPDAVRWLSTWMCQWACELYSRGDDGSSDETRAWAAEFLAESADPLPLIMQCIMRPDLQGFVSNTELLAAVEQHSEWDRVAKSKNPTMTKAWRKAVQSVGGKSHRKSDRGGRGWKGVSLAEAPPALSPLDFADNVDIPVYIPHMVPDTVDEVEADLEGYLAKRFNIVEVPNSLPADNGKGE